MKRLLSYLVFTVTIKSLLVLPSLGQVFQENERVYLQYFNCKIYTKNNQSIAIDSLNNDAIANIILSYEGIEYSIVVAGLKGFG